MHLAVDKATRCALYRRRRPEGAPLYRAVQGHLESYLALAREGHNDGGGVPQYVEGEFRRSLECGILAHGFAPARCGECGTPLGSIRGSGRRHPPISAWAGNPAHTPGCVCRAPSAGSTATLCLTGPNPDADPPVVARYTTVDCPEAGPPSAFPGPARQPNTPA